MATKLTIRDVSDSTRDVLAARAAGKRQSLSRYIADILDREAQTPTMDEVLDRITSRKRLVGGSDLAVDVLRDLRDAS
jgi:antitoxin FitA